MQLMNNSKIKDLQVISLDTFQDHRGLYVETFNYDHYKKIIPKVEFVQDDFSYSHRNVLRGIHGDYKTWKLIHCPVGEIFLVVVDWREESSTFKRWESFRLSQENMLQVLIPPGCGNGHYVLSEHAVFSYKQSTYYERESQFSIAYNDESLGIDWPLLENSPILSERDGYNS